MTSQNLFGVNVELVSSSKTTSTMSSGTSSGIVSLHVIFVNTQLQLVGQVVGCDGITNVDERVFMTRTRNGSKTPPYNDKE